MITPVHIIVVLLTSHLVSIILEKFHFYTFWHCSISPVMSTTDWTNAGHIASTVRIPLYVYLAKLILTHPNFDSPL